MMNSAYPLLDEKKYRCCGVHVEKAAAAIAVLGIVLQLVVLYPYWQWGRPFSGLNLIATLITLLIYGCILWAQWKREPRLYLPFLILNGIGILVLTIYSMLLLAVLVMGSGQDDGYYEAEVVHVSDPATGTNTTTLMIPAGRKWHTVDGGGARPRYRREVVGLLLVLWSSAVLSTFAQWVVYRAWKWMKLEKGSANMAATTYTVGSGFSPMSTATGGGVREEGRGASCFVNIGFDPTVSTAPSASPTK